MSYKTVIQDFHASRAALVKACEDSKLARRQAEGNLAEAEVVASASGDLAPVKAAEAALEDANRVQRIAELALDKHEARFRNAHTADFEEASAVLASLSTDEDVHRLIANDIEQFCELASKLDRVLANVESTLANAEREAMYARDVRKLGGFTAPTVRVLDLTPEVLACALASILRTKNGPSRIGQFTDTREPHTGNTAKAYDYSTGQRLGALFMSLTHKKSKK